MTDESLPAQAGRFPKLRETLFSDGPAGKERILFHPFLKNKKGRPVQGRPFPLSGYIAEYSVRAMISSWVSLIRLVK